jgi:hypothetical protein
MLLAAGSVAAYLLGVKTKGYTRCCRVQRHYGKNGVGNARLDSVGITPDSTDLFLTRRTQHIQHRTHSSNYGHLNMYLEARWVSSTTHCLHSIAKIIDNAAISSFHFYHVFESFTACVTSNSLEAGFVLVRLDLRLS